MKKRQTSPVKSIGVIWEYINGKQGSKNTCWGASPNPAHSALSAAQGP